MKSLIMLAATRGVCSLREYTCFVVRFSYHTYVKRVLKYYDYYLGEYEKLAATQAP